MSVKISQTTGPIKFLALTGMVQGYFIFKFKSFSRQFLGMQLSVINELAVFIAFFNYSCLIVNSFLIFFVALFMDIIFFVERIFVLCFIGF